MAGKPWKLEAALAALASRQHESVRRVQLRALGFTGHMIDSRVAAGLLDPVHPGVYILGYSTDPLARMAAALLACGRGALLSHATAGRLWLLPVSDSNEIEVTVVGR
jgi:hypothetical protein